MPAAYSRRNPSARYRRLLELCGEMHTRGEAIRGIAPERTFAEYWQELFARRQSKLVWEVRAIGLA